MWPRTPVVKMAASEGADAVAAVRRNRPGTLAVVRRVVCVCVCVCTRAREREKQGDARAHENAHARAREQTRCMQCA